MYSSFIKERFERCLDLYLCPRSKKKRINVDPQSLLPKLPKPQDLQPFPTTLLLRYTGHTARVRAACVWMFAGCIVVLLSRHFLPLCMYPPAEVLFFASLATLPGCSPSVCTAFHSERPSLYIPVLNTSCHVQQMTTDEWLLTGEKHSSVVINCTWGLVLFVPVYTS